MSNETPCRSAFGIRRLAFRIVLARSGGFTLIELMLGAAILAVVAVALIGGYLGESYLNENARNMMAAMNDATRVMEQIRVQNVGCTTPSAAAPAGYTNWDAWLNAQTPAKTVDVSRDVQIVNRRERIAVMCQDQDGGKSKDDYCGTKDIPTDDPPKPAQIGRDEWWEPPERGRRLGQNTTFDPIRVTVSVGWLQRGRTVGGSGSGAEFTTTGAGASAMVNPGPDVNDNGLIDSQVMLTTLMTCR